MQCSKELWTATPSSTIAHCWQKTGLLAPIRGVKEDDKTEIDDGEEDDSDEEVINLMLQVAAIDL
ncbi:hypothetical protein PC129_g11661 [Phytophthora cactorum]|uniref:Uncharacterized protein n=1 Tax=Phytophthora cactorum TaxID=29920 RepID=A0A329RSM8_9STRA|nr:hypothetical protein PC112_g16150 [Phytophthora cactorum]KAG2813484.1 hypothetical protein PC111_g14373 [Phytophthora cactorum]KAG2854173.1 hypothetical protein PC113_g13536 [Phytophthora cactorum]KAG2891323.1 hypothetical protein PC114_g17050 [Phytophthora cactorum]KAG2907913.1 hypothetical protein PC115_g13719 [Phytophthora cactorum]